MKKVTRAQLRGKQLEPNCQIAKRSTHEGGPNDNRIFCHGLYDASRPWALIEQCIGCKAHVGSEEYFTIEGECKDD